MQELKEIDTRTGILGLVFMICSPLLGLKGFWWLYIGWVKSDPIYWLGTAFAFLILYCVSIIWNKF
jgi:hypothetical protein